jgi:hypothetical protein
MSNKIDSSKIGPTFEIKDYLEAANDAASRTRTVTIVLIIATVLIGIGFWNSAKWSWPKHRVRTAYNADILESKFLEGIENPQFEEYKKHLQDHILRAYVDNVYFIKIPFFGIAFDVNDLGAIGGLSFIIILLLLRFSLSREIKNLNVSFREAESHDQLCYFYHALAMRQVFTVPEMKGERQNWFLARASKLVCILPLFVFFLGISYDYWSIYSWGLYESRVVIIPLAVETASLILIIFLSWKCWERQNHINTIWEKNWEKIDRRVN